MLARVECHILVHRPPILARPSSPLSLSTNPFHILFSFFFLIFTLFSCLTFLPPASPSPPPPSSLLSLPTSFSFYPNHRPAPFFSPRHTTSSSSATHVFFFSLSRPQPHSHSPHDPTDTRVKQKAHDVLHVLSSSLMDCLLVWFVCCFFFPLSPSPLAFCVGSVCLSFSLSLPLLQHTITHTHRTGVGYNKHVVLECVFCN